MLRLKWLIIGFAGAFAAVGALWVWYKVLRPGPAEVGRSLSEALEDRLHARPTVYLRKYVVVEEKKPIAELALVSRPTDVEHRMESELFYSRAKLALRGAFNVKAGFDLRSPDFSVTLDPGLKRARLDLPAPRVLSIEMTRYEVLEDESGWWNQVSKSDRELALRQMQAEAKLEAVRAGILKDCKQEIEKSLADLSAKTGVEVEFHYVMAGDSGRDSTALIIQRDTVTPR